MAATTSYRRNSTGKTCSDKSTDRLKREHFLHPDSDQIDLNLLLQAVLDLNEKMNKTKAEGGGSREKGLDAKRRLSSNDFDESASRHSATPSASRTRPKSAVSLNESKRPPSLERKNMSFSNTRVDAIDRENQRLLKEIAKRRGRPRTAPTKKSSAEPLRVQTSSEVNRYRFQRKVDMENQQILQRLQAIKPTRSLSRDSLMKEHIKQKQYSKTASKCRTGSSSSRASSIAQLSHSSSESSLTIGETASLASSRISSASRRSVLRRAKPVWESGW